MRGLKIAAASENDLTTGYRSSTSASLLSLGNSKDLFWGPNGGMKERDDWEKDGWAQSYLPSSKLQNTFFKLGGKNTGQFLWHQILSFKI